MMLTICNLRHIRCSRTMERRFVANMIFASADVNPKPESKRPRKSSPTLYRKNVKHILSISLVVVLSLIGGVASRGATRVTTASGGNWNATNSWSGGVVPASTDAAIILAGASVTVTADATVNSITFTNNSASTATLTVNSGTTLTVTAGIANQSAAANNTAALIQGAGTVNCASMTVGGTATPTPANSDFTATLTSTISNLSVSGNLTVKALYNSTQAAANQGTFALSSGAVSVGGSVAFVTVPLFGPTLTLATGNQNGTLTLSGSTPFSFTGGGSSTFTANGTNATVAYSGAAQTVQAATYQNLVLSGSGAKTTTGVTVNGILFMSGTATASAAPTYGASSTLEYNGSAAQISGPELAANLVNLTISNGNGVTVTKSLTVSNTLTLTIGELSTGAYQINLAANGSISGTSAASYVNGNVQKAFSTGTQSFIFPVGDSSSYAPLAVSNLSVTTAGSLKASTTAGSEPQFNSSGLDPNRSVNRYWTLTQSGGSFGTYNINLNYPATDLDAGAAAGQFLVSCWNGAWSAASVTGTPTSTNASLAGQNGFGDFIVGDPILSWYTNSAWPYRLAVTIGYTNVTGTLTNFPVLINITNSSLQQYTQTNGNDILFTPSDGVTKLAHEIESYSKANGALVAWVKVPLLSSTSNTVLYLYYGNASATNQQNVAGTWDSNFKGVWHMNNSLTDSTSNGNNGSNTLTINAAGKISNGRAFVRSNGVAFITISGLMGSSPNLTLSAWINMNSLDSSGAEFISLGDHVVVRQDGTGIVGSFFNGSTWLTTPSSTNAVGTGWRHVAFTLDSGGHSQVLYVDGVQIAASTFTNAISYGGYLGTNTIIGKHGNGATGFSFDGIMDEIRVSSTPRSAGWIATERKNQNSPAAFCSVGSTQYQSQPSPHLAISSVNGGASPTVNSGFSVIVQAFNADGSADNVTTNTAVTLSLNTGTGTLGGTLTGTIAAGTSSVTISGITYSKAESGVILTATRTSGDSLTAGNSSSFTVNPGAVSASQSTVSASPTTVPADNRTSSTITVTLYDAYGNPVSGKTVTLAKRGGSSTISAASGSSDASGVVTFTVLDAVGETATYTATDATDSVALTPTASVTFTSMPWYDTGWSYRMTIQINSTNVSGTLTNFPLLVNLTNSSLSQYVQASGNDLLFTAGDGTSKLAHEIESYTSSNGLLIAWVKMPLLSSAANTYLYLYYGNSTATNQQNATAVWDANFKAVWHLKETSGNFYDSTANANLGTNAVSATGKAGEIGNGQQFNGSGDYIAAANSASLGVTNKITLSAWVNYTAFATTTSSYACILDKGYDGGVGGYFLRLDGFSTGSSNALEVGSYTASPSTNYMASWTISGWNTNEWHHVVGLYDGSNWTLYSDGAQQATAFQGTGALTNTQPLTIGAFDNRGTFSRYSKAYIDEARISNTARSAGWISTEYNNQKSPAAFCNMVGVESKPPTALAITSVNGGSNPTVGAAFNVVVQAQDSGGTARNVTGDTAVTLSLNTGSGTLGGTLTGTITDGTRSVSISGVTYNRAGSGVVLTATRTSGDSLTAGNSGSFTVDPATVTVGSGLTANSKVYTGTTAATISLNNVVLSGVLAGDAANVALSTNSCTATFASATVGTNQTVTVSGLTLTGSAAGNYTLTQPSLSANIIPATLTVTANSATRPFGAPNPAFTASYNGFVNGEGSGVLSGTLVLSTTATISSPVGAYPIVLSQATLNSPNYTFNLVNGTLTVTEVPVTLGLQFAAGTGFQTNQAVLTCVGLTPGSVYHIQASASLTQWAEIGTAQAAFDGTMTFADTNAATYSMRFYRLSNN